MREEDTSARTDRVGGDRIERTSPFKFPGLICESRKSLTRLISGSIDLLFTRSMCSFDKGIYAKIGERIERRVSRNRSS